MDRQSSIDIDEKIDFKIVNFFIQDKIFITRGM